MSRHERCEQYAFENRFIVIQRVLRAIYDINNYDEWEIKDGKLTLLRTMVSESMFLIAKGLKIP